MTLLAEKDKYVDFLATKKLVSRNMGRSVTASDINALLFDFQRDLVRWALQKGRAALFADTGLGKTFMQVEWARLTGERTLILAPLSVSRQTVHEAEKLGVTVHQARADEEVQDGINVTNYEMAHHFNPAQFGAVVLDESSILKAIDGKTRQTLTDMFAMTPYRLCCTATPAPNDISEIANHAEFLGIMSRVDMLAAFFVHDDNGWRLKRHAEEPFYRWLASWGMSIRKPSDLGYSDEGYILPPLVVTPSWVDTEYRPDGMLFSVGLKGIQERNAVRHVTLEDRVQKAADIVLSGDPSEQWIVWHGLNDEGYALQKAIPGAILVEGAQSAETKAHLLEQFQDGKFRVLISKPRIAGFGMNFQNCHNMAFVGLSDSWEAYYQSIRRCYRFGQRSTVYAHIVLSTAEEAIYNNVMEKEKEATVMSQKLLENVKQFEKSEIEGGAREWEYNERTHKGDNYTALMGDCVERMADVDSDTVGLSIFSPPFMSLYTYTPTERDLGNSKTEQEFFEHFGYVIKELIRVTMPGRLCCVHVAQVPAMLVRDGYIGLKDFRGKTINAFEGAGWIYHGEVCIDKDPQAQAIRTKSKGLLFTQLHKDSSWSRPALADYILIFRKPGENTMPVVPDVSNNEWIEWARPVWYGIRDSDTLNVAEGRDKEDERHICPLQIGTIERCVRLWSNPGDLVLSPFMGIGSEGYVALKLRRHFIGIELKPSYFQAAVHNLNAATDYVDTPMLWSFTEIDGMVAEHDEHVA